VIEGVRFAHTVLSVCLSVDSQVALYFSWKRGCPASNDVPTLHTHNRPSPLTPLPLVRSSECAHPSTSSSPLSTSAVTVKARKYSHPTTSTSTNGCAALRSPAHPTTFHHFHFHQWLRSSQIACSPNHFPPLSTSTNGCAALRSPAHPTTFHHSHFHQWLRSSLPTKESCWQAPFTGCRQSQDSSLQEWTTQESRSVTATALPLRDTLLLLRHPAQISNCLKRVRSAC
jgi:hypothetical protein